MTTREAWERVTAKRQEHQTAAGLQATAGATHDDHERAGMEWLVAVCAEHGLDLDDVLTTMIEAQKDSMPEACFGGGFFSGFAVGLELKR